MSAGGAVQAAIVAALRSEPLLEELGIFDAPPVRALGPYAVVEDPVLKAFDGAGVTGRIGGLAIAFTDAGEVPTRLRLLMAVAETSVEAMPAGLADGWRVAGLELARSRLARAKEGWLGRAEWAVRVFRTN